VAERACISEAAVFKRYPTKAKLYLAAMMPADADTDSIVADEIEDTKEALIESARRLLVYFRKVVPAGMQLATHPSVGLAGITEHFTSERLSAIADQLTAFIAARQTAGKLRTTSPGMAARLLVATIHSLAAYEVMGLHGSDNFEQAIPPFLDQLWNGLAPAKS